MKDPNTLGAAHQCFTELKAWQQARQIKLIAKAIADTFPTEEKYLLRSQLLGSSRSTPANIAEGHGRRTFKDQHHFCIQARGSLSETLNHIIDAFDCNYISEKALSDFQKEYDLAKGLLNGYIVYLRRNFESNQATPTQPLNPTTPQT